MNNLAIHNQNHNASYVYASRNSCCNCQKEEKWIANVHVICRIALGIFAAVIAPCSFAISLSAGLIAGTSYACLKLWQNQPFFPRGDSQPICAQGYMDFLTGMRFPPLIGSLGTTAFFGAHLRHDPSFYVPFCGLFIGFWLGNEATVAAKNLSGRLLEFRPIK